MCRRAATPGLAWQIIAAPRDWRVPRVSPSARRSNPCRCAFPPSGEFSGCGLLRITEGRGEAKGDGEGHHMLRRLRVMVQLKVRLGSSPNAGNLPRLPRAASQA
jgi:hypothetical protein